MTSSLPKLRKHPSARNERNLHFPWAGVAAVIEEAKTAPAYLPLFDDDTGRGLWLVGDQGVYLMSNAAIDNTKVVYANECDPIKLPFTAWWEAKRATFGTDDGIEFIGIEDIEALADAPPREGARPHLLIIGIAPGSFTLSVRWATRSSK